MSVIVKGGGGGKSSGLYVWKKYEVILPFLSFIGNEDFTLKMNNTTKYWDGTLEYSTNKSTWNTWDGTEISSVGSKLYLRGTGNTKITGVDGSVNGSKFVFTGTDALKIACKGNIENLLDYETVSAGGHPTMASGCYNSLFLGCTSLTTAPELPATTLTDFCYDGMFNECTSLTSAPELPATTLADRCYENMFRRCTSLTIAPELSATTLASNCYREMFFECTSLTTIPSLPATVLAEYCYYYMFFLCNLIKFSTTQTGDYQTPYRIPTSGAGTAADGALECMFTMTGGTFEGTPEINTTYYLSTSNTVV